MRILSFDSSNSTLSTALLLDQKILTENTILENGKQAEMLICEIEKILHKNNIWYQDLDLIATTSGPGSFTGVRISIAAARGLKLATNLPLILVNSLEAVAYKYRQKSGRIFVAFDARMDEFFIGSFLAENNQIITLSEPHLVSLDNIANHLPQESFLLCGSGKNIVAKICQNLQLQFEMSEAEDIIEAATVGLLALKKFYDNEENAKNSDPLYLRDPKISERKEVKISGGQGRNRTDA